MRTARTARLLRSGHSASCDSVRRMGILRTLYDVPERKDAPPGVWALLWETRGADDRDERLDALQDRLEASMRGADT